MPRITSGHGNITAKRNSIFKPGRDMQKAHNVAIVQLFSQAICREGELFSTASMVLVNPFDKCFLAGSGCGQTTGIGDGIAQSVMVFQFKNSRYINAAGKRY